MVEAGGCVCRSADDYGVNGGATTATGGVVATLGWGRMMSMEEKRWATGKGRAAGHGRRRGVRMRVVTGGGNAVRGRLRDKMWRLASES